MSTEIISSDKMLAQGHFGLLILASVFSVVQKAKCVSCYFACKILNTHRDILPLG